MMLVGKIINIIGRIWCIFTACKFARDGDVNATILFCIFIIGFWM